MNLGVNWNGQNYALINLSEDQITYYQNDTEKLSEYFGHCLRNNSNICIVKSSEPTSTLPAIDVPSSSQQHTPSGKIIPPLPVKQAAKGPVKNQVKATKATVQGAGLKRKPSVTTEELSSVFSDDFSSTVAKKTTKKLSPEEQIQFDELLATLVMEQPLIYNFKLKSARFAGMKAEKWRIICDKLVKEFPNVELTLTKAKDRWSTLRDDFLKRLRLNTGSSGDAYKETEEEPMDDLLAGLKDVYNLEKTASNVDEPGGSFEEQVHISKQRKIQEKKDQEGALKIIEASSEKFLSAIEEIKVSVMNKKENKGSNEDKVSKFCDLLALQLRDLDDKLFLKAQIEIFQVISKLHDRA